MVLLLLFPLCPPGWYIWGCYHVLFQHTIWAVWAHVGMGRCLLLHEPGSCMAGIFLGEHSSVALWAQCVVHQVTDWDACIRSLTAWLEWHCCAAALCLPQPASGWWVVAMFFFFFFFPIMFCNLKWNCPEIVGEMGLGNGVHPMQA